MARYRSVQRGTAVLQKRKDGSVWTIRYRVRDKNSKQGWKHKREALPGCKSKKDALMVLAERTGKANVTNNEEGRGVTFAGFASGLWQTYLENRKVKLSTAYSYQSMLTRYLLPEFGEKRLDQVTTAAITQFFSKQRKATAKYRLNLYALLRVMFEVASEYDLVEANPVRRKLHRPQGGATKKLALTPIQLRGIIDHAKEEYRALLLTAAITGLRLGEVLGLRWIDVDLLDRKLLVTHSLWRDELQKPKTEASVRTLHLPASLVDVLLSHRERSPFTSSSDFVFCKRDGSPLDPNYLRKQVLYPAMKEAGIVPLARTHGFHMFRHSAGSIVHAKTGDLKLAQELLGHARISTTSDIYVHVPEKLAELATEVMAQELSCAQMVPKSKERTN
jgi:integrase